MRIKMHKMNRVDNNPASLKTLAVLTMLAIPLVSNALPLPPTAPAGNVQGQLHSGQAHGMQHSGQSNRTLEQTSLHEAAFADMANNLLPISPSQVQKLRALFNESQRAAMQAPGVPPKPTSSSLIVDLSPGSSPPVIRLGAGYVSSLVFLDSTGAPWPIQGYDLGDPRSYNVQWDKKGNTLMVQATTFYKQGNMAIQLKGLNTPIMITFLPGQQSIDYRVDLRVPGLGPNAVATTDRIPNTASMELLKVLDGAPPPNAKRMHVEGGNASAWMLNDHIFLRTRMTVVSPGWVSSMSGPDNSIHAYVLPKATIILALDHGRMVKLRIKEN